PRISAGRRSDLSGSYREPYPRPMGALTEFRRGGKKRPPKGNLSRGAGDLNIREGWVNRLRFSRLALGCLLAMSCRLVGTLTRNRSAAPPQPRGPHGICGPQDRRPLPRRRNPAGRVFLVRYTARHGAREGHFQNASLARRRLVGP